MKTNLYHLVDLPMRREIGIHPPRVYQYTLKQPADCSLLELFCFYLLVTKGGKVSRAELHQKIYSCQLLAFCYLGDTLIAISAIKRPSSEYINLVHQKAKIVQSKEDYYLEIGYSYTEPAHRRKGISSTLKEMLLDTIRAHKGPVFATTATPSSQHFLVRKGFEAVGMPYQGIFDANIIYYEKKL
ncbi:hypothetical protein [Pedobacter sp. MW01-1-1]|uniref:hypothetical protein n=1 Tax=Pedobacter sp. MW01-1-1 TaxID=3383027 RepID=UPI003FEF6897